MAGPRQPIELIVANGRKHVTQDYIEQRLEQEPRPLTDNIVAPDYLTKKQKEQFEIISDQLQRLKVMSETDVDAVARYIISRDLYVTISKQMNKAAIRSNPFTLEQYLKNQDKLFKQCRAAANDLGLSISSRCKLIVPKAAEAPPEDNNKFSKFKKVGTGA